MQKNSQRTAIDRSYRLVRKFSVDQTPQMLGDSRLIEALDDFIQKARDDEALGNRDGNSTRAEIKHFLFVDLAGGGAVGAADIVGQNF